MSVNLLIVLYRHMPMAGHMMTLGLIVVLHHLIVIITSHCSHVLTLDEYRGVSRAVMLPGIFPGAPLTFSGAFRNIHGDLGRQGLIKCYLCLMSKLCLSWSMFSRLYWIYEIWDCIVESLLNSRFDDRGKVFIHLIIIIIMRSDIWAHTLYAVCLT